MNILRSLATFIAVGTESVLLYCNTVLANLLEI
jgi:hypothetical protein